MNKEQFDYELVGREIYTGKNRWKRHAEDIVAILAIVAFISVIYWLGSTGAL
jgi:hypothetical protein